MYTAAEVALFIETACAERARTSCCRFVATTLRSSKRSAAIVAIASAELPVNIADFIFPADSAAVHDFPSVSLFAVAAHNASASPGLSTAAGCLLIGSRLSSHAIAAVAGEELIRAST